MRAVIVVVLMGLALWQAWVDWQATIGEGYAYRLTSIGRALAEAAPNVYAQVITAWRGLAIPYVWDPIGTTFLAMPLALMLAVLAGILWLTRRRARGRG